MTRIFKLLVILLIVFIVVYIAYGFMLNKMGGYLYSKDELKPADVIVILGGEENERVEYGTRLFKEGWARKDKIILSGGPLVWKHSWASLMKEYAIHLGIPKDAIMLEDRSRSIEENASFTKTIMKMHGYKSCIVITSPYQSKRAAKNFQEIMGSEIKIIIAPADNSWFKFDQWWKRKRDRFAVFNEYSQLIWLWGFYLEEETGAGARHNAE